MIKCDTDTVVASTSCYNTEILVYGLEKSLYPQALGHDHASQDLPETDFHSVLLQCYAYLSLPEGQHPCSTWGLLGSLCQMSWDLFQGYDARTPKASPAWRKPQPEVQHQTEGLGHTKQHTHERPTFPTTWLPSLGGPGCGPGVMRQSRGILRQILRAKLFFKSWKEIYHCETTLRVKSWALREITNTCNQIIFTTEISNSSYFLLYFYNSSGKGVFLYPTFQISTAELRQDACWNI